MWRTAFSAGPVTLSWLGTSRSVFGAVFWVLLRAVRVGNGLSWSTLRINLIPPPTPFH
jgi:hypothetical protein